MNKIMMSKKPEAVFRIRGDEVFWGPGLKELLTRIEETGSVKKAAADMYMSYTKARRLIDLAEQELGCKIVFTRSGGYDRGSTCLTDSGKELLYKCTIIQDDVQKYCEEKYRELFSEK